MEIPPVWQTVIRILIFFLIAYLVHRLGRPISNRLIRLARFRPRRTRPSPEREKTLQNLIASSVTFLAFLGAFLVSLVQFIDLDTLFWVVGLFSAAFGLGARPQISDFLSGVGFLFEDTFSVGEKVEIMGMEGVIERLNLRTTYMRAPTGELYTIPNGEIRVVRNFSRGRFSTVDIKVKVPTEYLSQTLSLLETLGMDAVSLLPNLIEPWQVLSETGAVGQHTELTLMARARFGKAADMRPRLLTLVHENLSEAGITLAD